jgi:sterol desaturase/sphingolipid hydroxylase (fatty acid hydroxylase superfamily)
MSYIEIAFRGIQLSTATVILTVLLESISASTVRSLLKQPGGRVLYKQAIFLNLFNHFILGVPVYIIAVVLFCSQELLERKSHLLVKTTLVILIHAVVYYLVHKAFHTYPSLYTFHRFHHRFNVHVPPMAANAVSCTEYILAYVLPFAIALKLNLGLQ